MTFARNVRVPYRAAEKAASAKDTASWERNFAAFEQSAKTHAMSMMMMVREDLVMETRWTWRRPGL